MSFAFGASAAPAAAPGSNPFSFGSSSTPSTGATGSGFNFGASTPAPASSGAGGFNFGSSTASSTTPGASSTPAAGGFNFGGGAAPATSSTGSGFNFGASGTNTSTAPASGFGFGSSSTTPAATSSAFSFGGGATSSASAVGASTGFGFGGSSAPTATSTPATNSSGFGFGFGTNTSSAAAPTTSLFGSTPAASQGRTTTGGAFNLSSAPSTGLGSSSSSLFGAGNTTPGSTSLFGGAGNTGSAPSSSTSLFGGGSSFGATPSQPPAMQAGANITLDTTFESLPEDMRKGIEEFGKFLKQQDEISYVIDKVSKQPLNVLQELTVSLKQDVTRVRNAQERQRNSIKNLRDDVRKEVSSTEMATYNMHCLKSEMNLVREIELPGRYWWETVHAYEKRMTEAHQQIELIAAQLRYQSESMDTGRESSAAMLRSIMENQHRAFLKMAGFVADAHERVEGLREMYLKRLEAKHGERGATGKVRNPFDAADRAQQEEERRALPKNRLVQPNAPAVDANKPAAGSTSLFGTANTGSLFGTTPSTPSSTAGGGGLFSSLSTSTPTATGGGGGLFGGTTSSTGASTTPFSLGGATGTGTTSLFGSSTPAAATPASGSLFGASAATPSTPAGTGGGLFGAASTPTAGSGLFNASSGGLFSAASSVGSAGKRQSTRSQSKSRPKTKR